MDNFSRIANNRGSILILVLWSLSLLTIFALYLGFGARQKIVMVKLMDTRRRLHFIAEAGVKQAILELKKRDKTIKVDALSDPWSNSIGKFKDVRLGTGRFTVSYVHLDIKSGARLVRYGITDEERKININKAPRKVVRNLFEVIGLDKMEAQSLSAAIVDWRDKDSELSVPLGSAEDRYYRNLDKPYEAKDDDFEILEELLLVRDMTREIFDKIKDFITIYGEGKININTASAEVLLAFGVRRSVVDKILSFRHGKDEIEATPDDNVFYSAASVISELNQFYSTSKSEVAGLSNLISVGDIVTNSDNFRIESVGRLSNEAASLKIICVFGYPPSKADESEEAGLYENGKIKYWQEMLN